MTERDHRMDMFTSWRRLARQTDRQLEEVKRDLTNNEKRPISSQTKMKVHNLKNEFRNIKPQVEMLTHDLLKSGHRFSDILTLTDAIQEYFQEELKTTEAYLKQYGYVPPEREEEQVDEGNCEEKEEEEEKNEVGGVSQTPPPSSSKSRPVLRTPKLEDYGLTEAKENEWKRLIREKEDKPKKNESARTAYPSSQSDQTAVPEIFRHRGIIVTPSLFGKDGLSENPDSPFTMNYDDLITPAAQVPKRKSKAKDGGTEFNDVKLNLEKSYDGDQSPNVADNHPKFSLFKSASDGPSMSTLDKYRPPHCVPSTPDPPSLQTSAFQRLVSGHKSLNKGTYSNATDSVSHTNCGNTYVLSHTLSTPEAPTLQTPAFQRMTSQSKGTESHTVNTAGHKGKVHLNFTQTGTPEAPELTSDLRFLVGKADFEPLPQTPELHTKPELKTSVTMATVLNKPTYPSTTSHVLDKFNMELPESPELTVFRGLKEKRNMDNYTKPNLAKELEDRYKYGKERTITPPLPELYRDKMGFANLKTPSPPKLIGTYSFMKNTENIPPK